MAEMRHPPLDPDYQEEPSFEEVFAGQMVAMLAAYRNDVAEVQGGYKVTYPVTDRIDIMTDNRSIGGALRIRRLQTLALSPLVMPNDAQKGGNVQVGSRTEDYSVVALEYGRPKNDNEEIADDGDFDWEPYVMSVASYETGTTDLLDGATGIPLSGGDLAEASHRLNFFARQISDLAYDHFLRGYDDALSIRTEVMPVGINRTTGNMFHDFDHIGAHTGLYEIHECFPGCSLEVHPETNQN